MSQQMNISYLRKLVVGLLIVCICLLTTATSQAVSYDWNSAGGPGGTWDLSSYSWWDSSLTVPANIIWNNLNTSDAVFGSGIPAGTFLAGGAVTVDAGGITAHNLKFNLNGYTIAGPGTLTLAGTTPAITVAGGNTATISANLAGSVGLQLNPSQVGTIQTYGTLILSGDNSGLSGTFNLGSGQSLAKTPTLIINSATALGTGAVNANTGVNGYSIIDATVDLAGPGSGVTLTTNNNLSLVNGNLYFGGTKNLNFGPTSQLQLDNTGSDARVFGINGSANITFGALVNLRPQLRNLIIPGTGTGKLIVGGIGIKAVGDASNRTFTIIGTHDMDVNGAITDSYGSSGTTADVFAWNNSGTLTMSGANDYRGTTNISAGTVVLNYGTGSSGNTSKFYDTTNLNINGSVNMQLVGGSHTEIVGQLVMANGGALQLSQPSGSSTMQFGNISGNNGATINLAQGSIATTTLATNTTAGILAPGTRACVTVGGTDWAKSGASGTNPITAITSSDAGWYQQGTWANDNELITAATTTLTASTNPTVYTLKVNNSASGNLDLNGNILTANYGGLLYTGSADYEIKNGTIKSGTPTASDLIALTYGSGTLTISSTIANNIGAGVLTKAGPGTLLVSGANAYTGNTFVDEGKLKLGSSTIRDGVTPVTVGVSGPLGLGNATLQVGSAGTVDLNGFNLGVAAIAGSFGKILNNNSTTPSRLTIGYNNGTSNTIPIIADGAGTVSVEKLGTGTWQIMWNNEYSGDTILTAGTTALRVPAGQTKPFGNSTVHMNGGTINWYSNPNQSASNVIDENFVIDVPVPAVGTTAGTNLIRPEPATIWKGNFTGTGLVSMQAAQGNPFDMQGNLTGFNGTFEINGSTLGMSNTTNVGVPNAAVTMVGSATLQWGGTASSVTVPIGSLASTSTNATVRNNGASNSTATFSVGGLNNASTSFAGSIRDASTNQITALTKDIAGNGTFILSGTNTYTGATTVNNGILEISGTGSLGATNITVNNGGTFKFDSGSSLGNGSTATSININGGSLQTAISLSNLNALNVNAGGTLAIQSVSGGITIGPSTSGTGVIVAGGSTPSTQGTISMLDGSINTLTLSSPTTGPALTLGNPTTALNPSILNMEIGAAGSDLISFTGSPLAVNPGGATINISGSGFVSGTDYPLLSFSSMSAGTPALVTLGTRPGGLYAFSLISDSPTSLATYIKLHVVGNEVPYTAYFRGNLSPNGTVWNAFTGSGATATTNWSTDQAGLTDTHQIPGGVTIVWFAADNVTYGNLNTTLGTDISIAGLHFTNKVGPTHAVTIGGSNALGIGTGGITIDSGSGAHIINTSSLNIQGSQYWTNNSTSAFTVNAPITGTNPDNMIWFQDGLFVLSGTGSTYAGHSTINSGTTTVRLGSTSALGGSSLDVEGTLDLNGLSFPATGLSGSGTITNSNATGASLNFNNGGTFGGTIQDGGGSVAVRVTGSGTVTLSSPNPYTGGTFINGGVLSIGNANSLGTTGDITFGSGTLQYGSGVTTDYSSRIVGSTSAVSIDYGDTITPLTYAGNIVVSNTGGLTKIGAGTLILSGAANAYTGTNNINGGTLKLGSSTALGNAANALTIASGAFLDLNGQSITQTGTVTLGGLTTGIITNSNTSTPATLNADIMNFTGGTAGLTLNSPGNIAFKRIDQVTGNATGQLLIWDSPATITLGTSLSTDHNRMLKLQLNQGTALLNMPNNGVIAVDRGLIIGNAANNTSALVRITGAGNNQLAIGQVVTLDVGTFDFNGHSLAIGGVQSDITTGVIENSVASTTSVVSITTDNATTGLNTFNGIIRDNSGTGGIIAVTKLGLLGTQTLTGVNTYTGPTTISEGTLVLSGLGSISNSSTISIASGAIFDVQGTSSIYSTGVGQTISGSGSIVGSYTHGQGTIVPGTDGTAGTLTFDNSTTGGTATISGGAIKFDVSPSTSSGNDLINIIGASSLSGGAAVTVNVSTALGYTTGTYTLINDDTGLSGSIAGWKTAWDWRGAAPTLTQTTNTVLLNVTAAGPGNNLNWSGTASGVWDIFNSVNWYNTTTNVPPPGPGLDTFHRNDNVTFGDKYDGVNTPSNTTAVTLNTVVAPTSVTVNANSLNYSISGTGGISGATSLVKSGAGTLTITLTNSANNSYSGGTIINGGILSISDDNNVGVDPGRITINKTGVPQAVLQSTATFAFAVVRPMTIGSGGGAIQVASGNTLTFHPDAATSATCDFEGPLSVQGDGALTVNLNGTPIVGAGASMSIAGTSTLNVGGTDPFTNGSTHMNVVNNGALNITSGSKTVANLTGTGNTSVAAGTTLTATSIVQNTVTLGIGARITIAPLPGGPTAGAGSLTAVPEPSTWAMLMLAAMGLGMYWRRSR
jgi:autotransporter-associated beta strand protein